MDRILFTNRVVDELASMLAHLPKEDMFVLFDSNTYAYWYSFFEKIDFIKEHVIVCEEGEKNKSIESAAKIWSVLSRKGARRNSLLINIGGGMITDLGGFAAACFKRGMRYINIPTTLLAQVDASVGGKTGVNFDGLKNEIGHFYFPEKTFIDPVFLKTLPERQFWSGYAEILKHALLSTADDVYATMEINSLSSKDKLMDIIRRSVKLKSDIVTSDPFEKGARKSLNFGHTAGHAMESIAQEWKCPLYHGEAVAYGMLFELYLSVQKKGFELTLYKLLEEFIFTRYGPMPRVEPEIFYRQMLHDKKNGKAEINFTLLRRPGEYETDVYCTRKEIMEVWSYFQS